MKIVKRGNKIIDTDYLSEKFGLVVMDITQVEESPTKEIEQYLRNMKVKERV
jgi:hypothetical protein